MVDDDGAAIPGGRQSNPGEMNDPKGFDLHARLVAGERSAIDQLWLYYYDLVAAGMRKLMRRTPDSEDIANEYAQRAIIRLIESPTRFDPSHNKSLYNYLRMDVEGDILNHVASRRYRTRVESLDEPVGSDGEDVGDLTRGGNLAADDPQPDELVVGWEGDETVALIRKRVVEREDEGIVFDLQYIHAEKSTGVFAEALGLAHLPAARQAGEVQKIKDRLAKRLRRMREDFK